MNPIAYPIGDNLYLNITNRCTNACVFCIRNKSRHFNQQYPLWLEREPGTDEIIAAMGDYSKYHQIVFCGYGEPLIRLDTIKEVSRRLATRDSRPVIRLNTNGHANLFWGRNILPELKGLIDIVSISLNADNATTYNQLCHPAFGEKSYAAVIEFIKEAKKQIPEVEVTAVDLPEVDKEACHKIAESLGVSFRIRPYYEETYAR